MDEPPKFYKKLENVADNLRSKAFKTKTTAISEFGTHYGSFHRRMLAATLDTFVLSLTILPLSYIVTNATVDGSSLDLLPLFGKLQPITDAAERATILKNYLLEDGRLNYFYANTLHQLIGMFAYCMIFWRYLQATPGKWLVRLVVVDEKTGEALGWFQGFWRCVGYIFSCLFLCLGIFWISWDKRSQGWHDKFASTVVIVKPKNVNH